MDHLPARVGHTFLPPNNYKTSCSYAHVLRASCIDDIVREDLLRGNYGKAFTYASFFLGLTLLPVCTPNCTRLYSFDPTNDRSSVPGRDLLPTDYQRYGSRDWERFHHHHGKPEVLFVHLPHNQTDRSSWLHDFVEIRHMWSLIVILEEELEVTHGQGATYKHRHKYFRRHGYTGFLKYLSGQSAGAAMSRGTFWTFYLPTEHNLSTPETTQLGGPGAPRRSIANCLQQAGVGHHYYIDPDSIQPPKELDDPSVVGHYQGRPIYGSGGPIPARGNCYVVDRWGIRPIFTSEWCRILGVPDTWSVTRRIMTRLLLGPTSQEWSVIVHAVTLFLATSDLQEELEQGAPRGRPAPTPPEEEPSAWSWSPPDLGPRSTFRARRISNMHRAIRICGGGEAMIASGLAALDRHATNYGPTGPTSLTILWWEWDMIHWPELRDGASMNFITAPTPGIVSNSPFTPMELETAKCFVDELISLKVLVPAETPLLNNLPVFLVDKPDQPGQKRTIADGKAGGQNPVCSSDPVHFAVPKDILPYLYPGGWSGSVDCSKFFHMFIMLPSERPYLGILHPVTDEHYWYERLPMGTSNSPGVASRFGVSFLRLVRRHPVFQGEERSNTFVGYLRGQPHCPEWGTG